MSELADLVRRYFRAQNLTNVENGLLAVAQIGPKQEGAYAEFLEIEEELKQAVGFEPNPYWEPIVKRMLEYSRGHEFRSQMGADRGSHFIVTHHPASYFEWRDTGKDWIENETESEATQIS